LNVVSSAGEIKSGSESIRLHPTGEFENLDELGDLLISPHGSGRRRGCGYCHASRGLSESPSSIYHANGRQAVTMGSRLFPASTSLTLAALEAKLEQMSAEKPAGSHRPVLRSGGRSRPLG
jgi:multidrug efflux pump subunit AcrB